MAGRGVCRFRPMAVAAFGSFGEKAESELSLQRMRCANAPRIFVECSGA
jgi:hypothetical protein